MKRATLILALMVCCAGKKPTYKQPLACQSLCESTVMVLGSCYTDFDEDIALAVLKDCKETQERMHSSEDSCKVKNYVLTKAGCDYFQVGPPGARDGT